ncbi:MAG: lytic transglycosylase domain-containing protein [Nevskiaceae bacterium]|nr:MAG: lytic transglycosylase domain-containing protein [Nevskiaceae bacterium]TBR74469.1 MAG: lytic transglycosylase domain-containing protein [Nevskiaceae bacterium]
MRIRLWLAGALIALVALPAFAAKPWVHSGHWGDKYDRHFAKYSKRYFGPFFDWHWFKAQAIVESTLQANAKSPVGAYGIMQMTPETYEKFVRKFNPHFGPMSDPAWNIAAGIWYDHYLFSAPTWNGLDDLQRLYFAFAGFNAGLGGVLDAYRKAQPDVTGWRQVAPYAPAQTRNYVRQIIEVKTNEAPAWLRDRAGST